MAEKEKLYPGATASVYKEETGEPAEQFRDVSKTYDGNCFGVMSLGIENQSRQDNTMPVRVMGYDYGTYRGMGKSKESA